MTLKSPNVSAVPFSRRVNRVELLDSKVLERRAQGPVAVPMGPILFVPVDAPLVNLSAHFGVTAIDGCDVLFFDIQAGGSYFCNIASAADPLVVAALKYWGASGEMPLWLETQEGPCGFARHPFKLNDVYRQAFVDANRNEYTSDLQLRLRRLLKPGVLEAVVASRTGRLLERVEAGFLATSYTQPALEPIH